MGNVIVSDWTAANAGGGAPTVPSTNLVHEYLLDGDGNDSIGSSDLTPTSITYSTPSGHLKQVAEFNGTTSYFDLGSIFTELNKANSYTVSVIFKRDAAGGYDYLWGQDNATADRVAVGFYNDDTLRCSQYVGSRHSKSTTLADTTDYHHLIITWDGSSTLVAELDGVDMTGSDNAGTTITGSTYVLGNRQDKHSALRFGGDMASLRIYDAVLGSTDRAALRADAQHRHATP